MINIDRMPLLDTPLTSVAKHAKIVIALPNNAEGRNGQFRNGGHYQGNGLDACTTQTPQQSHVFIRRKAAWEHCERAIRRGNQQSSGDVYRTVQNATTRQNIEVSSASSTEAREFPANKPRRLPRRSIESRHVHCSIALLWLQGQGRVGRDYSMYQLSRTVPYVRYGTWYLYALAVMRVELLLERQYAEWERGGDAA